MVQFHALGGVAVTDDGREINVGGPRQRRLLAMLLVHRNSVVSVDRLADAVFAGEPTPAASTTLRSYIARIRKVLASDGSGATVVTQAPGYVLRLPDEAFDVARFEQGLGHGRSLLARGEAAEAAAALRGALSSWRGEAYAEFADEEWVQPEAQRLNELRLVAAELRFDAELASGRAAEVIAELESVVGRHPLREAFVAQLMTALYRAGRQADALRVYRHHRDVLVEELGLDPAPALQELEERILSHAPDLVPGASGAESLRGYRLGERLGTGRDGVVHAAHLPGVDRDLVVRVVRAEVADAPDFVRSFEANAQRLVALRHPAVVPIHDYWREPGAAYVVMRRMHGGSLADRLERLDRRPLTVADVTAVVQRIGAALVAAKETGLAHGRVDPCSVLFDEAGEAWLADFDLGAGDPTPPSDDVEGLARLVRACIPHPSGPVADVIERGLSSTDRPPMEAYVPLLLGALTGGRIEGNDRVLNPYKGLRAFDESDADDFFGRADLVSDLLTRFGRADLRGRLALVVGGSGTGKSSVVRAGLLPRVRRGDIAGSERWYVTTMLPGATPFKELAAALRRVAVIDTDGAFEELTAPGGIDAAVRRVLPRDGQLLLVIDQFEELFTSAPEAVQRRFLDGLMHAITEPESRVRVVGTLRADFYDRPLAFQPFGGAVNDATVTIPAMSPAELEAAIVEPAERAGRGVERALVAELVSAAADEPAGLPALQFTLFELAVRSEGDLTLDAYRQLGGLSGAIASRAETLYRSLDDDERATVRRLFQQLVVVSGDAEPTRRRAVRSELTADDPAVDQVIDRWAEARLLSLDRHRHSRLPTVEPAHEALLREWPRLRRWIEEDREALLVLGRLRESAVGWVELDRDPGALYRGARLQVALDILGAAPITPLEREFLDASAAARDVEVHEAQESVARTARANRRLRRQLLVIGVALVVALVGGFVAVDQRQDARRERRTAFVRELAAAADANLGEDPELATLLALEALAASEPSDTDARPEALGALHDALSRTRILLTVPGVGGDLDWSPDGSLFITEGPDETGLIDLRDAETGASVRAWVGHDVDVNGVVFGPDGDRFATGGDDGYLRVWDTSSGDLVAEFQRTGATSASAMSFSPDGRFLVGHWLDSGDTVIYDLRSSEARTLVERATLRNADFSPGGAMLALALSSSDEEVTAIMDPGTGQVLHRIAAEEGSVAGDARFSPDGRWLATAHVDGAIRLWDASSFELRSTVTGHRSEATSVAWSPDSTRLATAGNDGTARVHDLIPGGTKEAVVVSSRDTANGIPAVRFSPDGQRIMTSDWTIASVQVWDVSDTAGGEWADMRAGSWSFGGGSGSFLPDGRALAVRDGDGELGLWRPETGRRLGTLEIGTGPDQWVGLEISPDGSMLAEAWEGGVRLWDLAHGGPAAEVKAAEGAGATDMAWSRDSDHLAIAHRDQIGVASVVDSTGASVATIAGGDSWAEIKSLTFVGDGDEVAIVTFPARPRRDHLGINVWDWRRDEITIAIETLAEQIAADPSGPRVVATEVLSGSANIFDIQTGELLQKLRGAGTAYSVEFSPDGERVALGAADGTVRVFHAGTGRLELTLRGHLSAVTSVSFSPDGTKLASSDDDGHVRVWALDEDELVELARRRVTRALDDDECQQYLRQERCG